MNSPESRIAADIVEDARARITHLVKEIADLSERDIDPSEYYAGFLQRLLAIVAGAGGAVWLSTPQGPQLQAQVNLAKIGLDAGPARRQAHEELLRRAAAKAEPVLIWPADKGSGDGNGSMPANPTDHVLLIAPIVCDKQVAGLIEIWQDPTRDADAQRGFLNFMVRLAELAAGYTRKQQLRELAEQQQAWTQVEAFGRQIHGSLDPTEVGYHVANEGRRLTGSDRVSVAVRQDRRATVLAISGAEFVEQRSNLVQLMRQLFEQVMKCGETLVYRGSRDESLPPDVLKALDAYLAVSNSRLLVVRPLRDDREKDPSKPARSAILMECFNPGDAAACHAFAAPLKPSPAGDQPGRESMPPMPPEQVLPRLEMIARQATSALYNAVEHRRIPLRFLWRPLARLQEGIGGKARTIWACVLLALVALLTAMIFVPYPLKMDASGQLLPIKRAYVYSSVPGQVIQINKDLKTGDWVHGDQELIRMYSKDLETKITELESSLQKANLTITELRQRQSKEGAATLPLEVRYAEIELLNRRRELQGLRETYNADLQQRGQFFVCAPLSGIILSGDFRETLTNRFVKPSEPLLRIGYVNTKVPAVSDWEIELRIPEKHIGQVVGAYTKLDATELDVDLLLVSAPTRTFKGKLSRGRIASEANVDRDSANESGPTVLGWVRVHGSDIPEEYRLTPDQLLLTGTEVHARIRCGDRAMGYSLFYGVWEFVHEKILFWF